MATPETACNAPTQVPPFTARGGGHLVHIDEFFASVAPLDWYRDWSHALDTLCSDRLERRIVDTLAGELTTHGRFREPVRVTDSELANGYHRLCATVVATAAGTWDGHLEVWVEDDEHPDPAWDDNTEILEFDYQLDSSANLTHDDICDVFFSAARSLRIDAHTWAEADCAGFSRGRWTISYLGLGLERARDVNNAVTVVLGNEGVTATLLNARTYRLSELDD